MRDFFGRQSANFTQCESYACLWRQCRVTACEYKPETIVLDAFAVEILHAVVPGRYILFVWLDRSFELRPAAHAVDGFEASGRNKPRPLVGRDPVPGPLFHRGGERFVHCILGCLEVAEEADQRGKDAARLAPVNFIDSAADFSGGIRRCSLLF
jgi:hypothetical protein